MSTDGIITLILSVVFVAAAAYNIGEAQGIRQGKYEVDCYAEVYKTRVGLVKAKESPCFVEKIHYDSCKEVHMDIGDLWKPKQKPRNN